MPDDYEQLFVRLVPAEPPEKLLDKIMRQIHREQQFRIIKRRLAFLVVVLIGSVAALAPAFQMMRVSFVESGFMEFVALAFSDSTTMLAYWKSFVLALLESLPTMGIVVFLAAILAFVESFKLLIQNVKAVFTPFNPNNNAL